MPPGRKLPFFRRNLEAAELPPLPAGVILCDIHLPGGMLGSGIFCATKLRYCGKVLVVAVRLPLFHLRQKCLLRGVCLALCAFAASLFLAGFPYIENLHGSRWQVLTMLAAGWGMGETARCIRRRWSFYHAGVILLLYSELMILVLTAFLTFYP